MTTKPQSTTEPELKPCRCGRKAMIERFHDGDDPQPLFVATCEVCPVKTYDQFTAEEAARVWNEFVSATVNIPDGQWQHVQIKAGNPRVVGIQFETAEQATAFINSFAAAPASAAPVVDNTPIDMVLFCPRCGTQHVDAPEDDTSFRHRMEAWSLNAEWQDRTPQRWTNPPHKSHLCHNCFAVWRPADVPTNGAAQIKTRGKEDNTWTNSAAVPAAATTAPQQSIDPIGDFVDQVWKLTNDRDGWSRITLRGAVENFVRQFTATGSSASARAVTTEQPDPSTCPGCAAGRCMVHEPIIRADATSIAIAAAEEILASIPVNNFREMQRFNSTEIIAAIIKRHYEGAR